MDRSFELDRFVEAQEGVYSRVLEELTRGRKASHWMWFVFPQIQGLGFSDMARKYAIASPEEARAFLNHPILGARLRECTQLVVDVEGSDIRQILGSPDDLKFRSSMTLFLHAAADNALFATALAKYCGGEQDQRTVERLQRRP